MTRIRVKICGITRAEDAHAAVMSGADAIGLVFYRSSPRFVDPETAACICRSLPPFVCKVGVFVNEPAAVIGNVLDHVGLDLLQFHGDETAEACAGFGIPYIKAVRVRSGTNWKDLAANYRQASALLLDTYVEGTPGGSGQTFDWLTVPRAVGLPLILAGGLCAANVGAAIKAVQPYGVDVSGGVESAPGVKDPARIEEFMLAVRSSEAVA